MDMLLKNLFLNGEFGDCIILVVQMKLRYFSCTAKFILSIYFFKHVGKIEILHTHTQAYTYNLVNSSYECYKIYAELETVRNMKGMQIEFVDILECKC
jgi:hypothetical protein